MVMCFAPDCKHYSEKQGCRFFVFPKDPNEKKKWIALIRRKDRQPSMHSLVCSCHFKDGDRQNRPTIFEHNKLKRFCDEPSTSNSSITKPRKLKRQKLRHFGDCSSNGMNSPTRSTESWRITKKTVFMQRKKIKNLQTSRGRLKARIYDLNTLVKYMQEKYGVTESAASAINVTD